MVIDKKYKWVYSYTMACTRGNLVLFQRIIESEKFEDFFKGDFSRQKVRDYFMGPHNLETLNGTSMPNLPNKFRFFHLAIPYEIKSVEEEVKGDIFLPFYKNIPTPLLNIRLENKILDKARELGILERELRTGEILISHASFIADICEKKDLVKYSQLYERMAA